MSLAVLDRLEEAHARLIAALDGDDVGAVEAACMALAALVGELRVADDWTRDPANRDRLAALKALTDAAQVRVNFLTDRNAHRIEGLAAARGLVTATAYRRDGRRTV